MLKTGKTIKAVGNGIIKVILSQISMFWKPHGIEPSKELSYKSRWTMLLRLNSQSGKEELRQLKETLRNLKEGKVQEPLGNGP